LLVVIVLCLLMFSYIRDFGEMIVNSLLIIVSVPYFAETKSVWSNLYTVPLTTLLDLLVRNSFLSNPHPIIR